MSEPPWGLAEGPTLEFKRSAALNQPGDLARAVVSFLNTESGGDLWIGFEEVEGRAAAVDPVPDATLERERLENRLLDSIEPRLRGDEVTVRTVSVPGGSVLHVAVRPQQGRGPFAHEQQGSLRFVVRVGARTRALGYAEIAAAMRDRPPAQDQVAPAREHLLSHRSARLDVPGSRLWVGLMPAPLLAVDVQDKELHRALLDPEISGGRANGWGCASRYGQLALEPEGVRQFHSTGRSTIIGADGSIRFEAPIADLHWTGEPSEIDPLALSESVVSVLRLGAFALEHWAGEEGAVVVEQVVADLAMLGAADWQLRAGSPLDVAFGLQALRGMTRPDYIDEPLVFPTDQVRSSPDWCAFRLLRRLYQAYGHAEDALPRQFDRKTQRLVLPA